jgi:prolyl-tRNA synthetase
MRGVPLRIEIGPKDVAKDSVAFARRDIPGREGKSFVHQEGLDQQVADMLGEIQSALLARAKRFRQEHTFEPANYEELKEAVQKGWAFAWWCGSPQCEAKVKEDTKATTRCIPLDQPGGEGPCVVCGETASNKVIFARAY